MNTSTLYSYMSGLGIPTGSTACLYAFTSGSGQIVFNELVSNEENFLDNNVNKLNGNVLPGIALGDENPRWELAMELVILMVMMLFT